MLHRKSSFPAPRAIALEKRSLRRPRYRRVMISDQTGCENEKRPGASQAVIRAARERDQPIEHAAAARPFERGVFLKKRPARPVIA
jgi:hypothetical protein